MRIELVKVFVYYNLHRRCLSVRALEGAQRGKVLRHAAAVALGDVRFKVSEAGRQRVLRERAKNVHAGLAGCLLDWIEAGGDTGPWASRWSASGMKTVTYDPYRFDSFVIVPQMQAVHCAGLALVVDKVVYVPDCAGAGAEQARR